VEIPVGGRETVGDYSVEVQEITGNTARVSVCYKYKAWEEVMYEYIDSQYGLIDVPQMINWSRLHEHDLQGLRPMCEDQFLYESVYIMKIPKTEYSMLSSGWFAANHACVSIYVPTHNANTDVFDPYETGDAAELSLELLDAYGHGNLTPVFKSVETVFFSETNHHEQLVREMNLKPEICAQFLTIVDMAMQHQAWMTEQIWFEMAQTNLHENSEIRTIVSDIWDTNYTTSLEKMRNATVYLYNTSYSALGENVLHIMMNITESRLNTAALLGYNTTSCYEGYQHCLDEIEEDDIETGIDSLVEVFFLVENLLDGEEVALEQSSGEKEEEYPVVFFLLLLIGGMSVVVFFIVVYRMRKTK
jgi:hypothetical protein